LESSIKNGQYCKLGSENIWLKDIPWNGKIM